MKRNQRDDPEEEGTDQEPTEVCTVCRQTVPLRLIITMMMRPVCLNCAGSFYEEDGE
jgi:hypothetical protein